MKRKLNQNLHIFYENMNESNLSIETNYNES